MSIKKKLEDDLKQAMKARNARRTGCIRMLKSKLLEREVAQRAKKGKDYSIDDDEAQAAISTYAKQRRDSIDSYTQGGRDDLAAEERAELEIVMAYLPRQLSTDDLRAIVSEAIAESGASSPKHLGAVMRIVVPRTKGAADGKIVSGLVRELLDSSES